MFELNQALFLALNAPSQPPAWLVHAVAGLASSPVLLAPAVVVALWIWGEPARRGALIAIAISVVMAQGLNLGLGLLWFDPRPFIVPLGHTLVAHAADNGFPSDHATLVWTLGAGLWPAGAAPRLHGTAISLATGQGFTDDGRTGMVLAFDFKTLEVRKRIPTNTDADAAVTDKVTGRLYVIEGDPGTVTVIDPTTDAVMATIKVGEKMEYAATDGNRRRLNTDTG